MKSNALRGALIGFVSVLVAGLLVASGFLGARLLDRGADEPAARVAVTSGTDAADFNLLAEIAAILGEDYVDRDRATADILRDGAIEGMFKALNDPHSTYIDPNSFALSKNDLEGAFEGIGATVAKQNEWVVIVRPISGTPAERAGLKGGDQVLEVDGESAENWSVQQAVLKIRGPVGTKVALKVRHPDGKIETLQIERASIPVESVTTAPPGGILKDAAGNEVKDLAYIRIQSFGRTTPQEFEKAVKAAEAAGARGILLDVRSNPGGLLQQTVQIADMLLDKGYIFFQVDREGRETNAEARAGVITNLPIVMLQDEFSASGSELLAGALQENGRAKVIGTRSLGKGTVNHSVELSNGGAVYVSIARWLTPKHNQIEGRGITPDVEVALSLEDAQAGRDVQVYRAIELLRTGR